MGQFEAVEQERFCAAAWPKLVAAMTYYCGDVHLAEEFVQEALLRACGRWRQVSQLESPEGWAYRVAVNLSRSRWRRRQIEQRAHRREPARQRDDVGAVADRLLLHAALQELTEAQREAVVCRYVLDYSAEQVAAVLGSSPGAVRALTHRAVARLRERLDLDATVWERDDVY